MPLDTDPIAALIAAGRILAARGWTPATSGNLSVRAPIGFWVTASGCDKGNLARADVLLVDAEGRVTAGTTRPSAETALHAALYARDPTIGAVLHVHSPNATVLSRVATAPLLELAGYELAKAFAGVRSHEVPVRVPLVENDQDVAAIVRAAAPLLSAEGCGPGYLIRGHGLYTWGSTVVDALRHAEAFDFLFGCELAQRSLLR